MTPPRLVEAADELLRFLDANGRSACLIGGIVVSRWGEPRATKEIRSRQRSGSLGDFRSRDEPEKCSASARRERHTFASGCQFGISGRQQEPTGVDHTGETTGSTFLGDDPWAA